MYGLFHLLGWFLGVAVVCIAGSAQNGQVNPEKPARPSVSAGHQSPGPGSTTSSRSDAGMSSQNTPEPPAKDSGATASANETASEGAKEDSALQLAIQNALERDPSLGGKGVRATVTETAIELSGSVATSRDKLKAGRLALSYPSSKKLVNRITITGTAAPSASAARSPEESTNPSPTNRSQPSQGVNQLANPQPKPGSRPPIP